MDEEAECLKALATRYSGCATAVTPELNAACAADELLGDPTRALHVTTYWAHLTSSIAALPLRTWLITWYSQAANSQLAPSATQELRPVALRGAVTGSMARQTLLSLLQQHAPGCG